MCVFFVGGDKIKGNNGKWKNNLKFVLFKEDFIILRIIEISLLFSWYKN